MIEGLLGTHDQRLTGAWPHINMGLLTSLTSRAIKVFVFFFRHLPGAGRIELGRILENQTEGILELPGSLPFFPTRVTDADRVTEMLEKLFPIDCGRALVRLGPDADGGYLVPDDFEGIKASFSPGVSDNSMFELGLAERGIRVFLADASVSGPSVSHELFEFEKKFLGAVTQGPFITLCDWVQSSLGDETGDLLLQMDIEGFEYETLLAVPDFILSRFRIMVVEFHFLDRLFSEPVFEIYSKVFEKLLHGHACVHIHPNNVCGTFKAGGIEIPQMAEYTFIRKDRVTGGGFVSTFPHPLDRDNVSGRSVVLPGSCFNSGSVRA